MDMAKSPGANAVYEVAGLFRQRCLAEGHSFLWPDHPVWTKQNLRKLWEILMRAESQSELSSLSSIATTLSKESTFIQMIAVDVLAAGCFFPAVKTSTQHRYFQEFLDALDLPEMDSETWRRLGTIFDVEVPGSFTYYKGGKKDNYFSVLFGLMVVVEHDAATAGRDALVRLIETKSSEHEFVWNSVIWGMFHTMYAQEFVAVPGEKDRAKILKSFAPQIDGQSFDNDFAALDFLRKTMSSPREDDNFDFYSIDMLKQWAPHHRRIGWLSHNGTTPQPEIHEISSAGTDVVQTSESSALSALISTTHLSSMFLQDIDDLLRDKRQLIFEGPPGSGKTYVAEKFARWFTGQALDEKVPLNEQVEIVQFHQSYGYEDFVQGIRPRTNEHGQLIYQVEKGIFLEMCERAIANSGKPFVLIIDEINRGNLSRIFGELLLLVEYRGMSVRLPYGDDTRLTIPENLHIIGTMNTTDRSLAQIDYALRRRFYFVRFMPVEDGRAYVFENWLNQQGRMSDADRSRLLTMFIDLNEGIREYLNTDDLQVGHSYFMTDTIETEAGFQRVWSRAVEPLMNEYLHHHRDRDEILAALTPAELIPVTVGSILEDEAPVDDPNADDESGDSDPGQ
jgi:MoxR-like ATPase